MKIHSSLLSQASNYRCIFSDGSCHKGVNGGLCIPDSEIRCNTPPLKKTCFQSIAEIQQSQRDLLAFLTKKRPLSCTGAHSPQQDSFLKQASAPRPLVSTVFVMLIGRYVVQARCADFTYITARATTTGTSETTPTLVNVKGHLTFASFFVNSCGTHQCRNGCPRIDTDRFSHINQSERVNQPSYLAVLNSLGPNPPSISSTPTVSSSLSVDDAIAFNHSTTSAMDPFHDDWPHWNDAALIKA